MEKKIILGNNVKQTGSRYLLMAFVLNLLLLGGNVLTTIFSPNITYAKYIPMVYYGILSVVIVFFLPAVHTMGKMTIKEHIIGLCITGSVIYIAINFGAGVLLKNLASSPYDTSLKGIANNMANHIPVLIASIFVRTYSVNAVYRKASHPYLWIVIISLFLAALEFNYAKLSVAQGFEDFFISLVQDILPKISLSFLLTIICLTGGSLPCIYYTCIQRIFMFIFPFIPSLPWIAESVIGLAYPILFSMFLWDEYKILSHLKPASQNESIFALSVSLIVSTVVLWFIVGVFSIYPSVILTGSMEPMIYPGDVILINKLTSEEEIYRLKAGDIINFKKEDSTVTHRIAEVKRDEAGNLSFITKGDNNYSEDPWIVSPNDLKGTVEHIVPKIGKPIVFLYSSENTPEGVMDY